MHTANRASTEPFPAFSGFRYRPALPYEAGVSRRDPSPVLRAGGRYYVWYSRSTHDASGYQATIWYATSTDGLHWAEHGQALGRGPRGAFDEHAVFTPTVMVAEDCYWLYYTAVPEPFHNAGGGPAGTPTRIGVASAARPDGPWERTGTDPILEPDATPERFDSHRVDDSCLVRRGGEYRLYYKGRQLGLAPNQTRMGLATAARPVGPYTPPSRQPRARLRPRGVRVAARRRPGLHRRPVRTAGRHPAIQRRRRALSPGARHRPAARTRSLPRGPLARRQRPRHRLGPVPEHRLPVAVAAALRHRPARAPRVRRYFKPVSVMPRTK